MYEKYFKRILDVIISGSALILLSPIYLIVAVLVYINMGSPIIFRQERLGKDEKPFIMYKFRSMKNSAEVVGNIDDDRKRLTKFGIFIRSTSIDELPELVNVFKGDMSLVGPRPMPSYYLPYYTDRERKRHKVKGGLIPCDALVGGADISWEDQFDAEIEYAEHVSFCLDVELILKTIKLLYQRTATDYGKIDRPLLNEIRQKRY